jgi:hypothetical protein
MKCTYRKEDMTRDKPPKIGMARAIKVYINLILMQFNGSMGIGVTSLMTFDVCCLFIQISKGSEVDSSEARVESTACYILHVR